MPFFSSRKPEDEVVEEHHAPVHEEQHQKRGLFGSRKEHVVEEPTPVHHEEHQKRGLFGSRRERSVSPVSTTRTSTTSTSHSSSGTGRKGSILQRSFGHGNKSVELDPSIVQARERVMGAEAAEHEADRALNAARIQVREAREQVKRLELEAKEEARLAKIKQYHAAEVSKRGKQLGRTFIHFPYNYTLASFPWDS
ncbi:hypothetical protein PG989_011914 [Apiospora arundinis]